VMCVLCVAFSWLIACLLVVSVPLGYIASMYSMNIFRPEANWEYTHVVMWIVTLLIGALILWFFRGSPSLSALVFAPMDGLTADNSVDAVYGSGGGGLRGRSLSGTGGRRLGTGRSALDLGMSRSKLVS
jgi:hypothetical protein